ncbi:MAG: TonB family protein [Fluviibacter sp.]|jgi:TonB family protein
MPVAPPTLPPTSQPHTDPEHWEIKPLGWRSLFTDRLLWLAIGISFVAHLVILAPHYGIKLPQHGSKSVTVSFRMASQPMAHPAANQTPPAKTERRPAKPPAHQIQRTPSQVSTQRPATVSANPTPAASATAGQSAPATGNRRVTLTPGMKDYRYSQYLEDWRRKVERVGAMNYPEEARGKFFGSLVLSVALRPDGSVDRIVIVRSSGNPILDEAAKRIVTFAAPFAPFPPDIRQETDYLDITRTWNFTRGNALETR